MKTATTSWLLKPSAIVLTTVHFEDEDGFAAWFEQLMQQIDARIQEVARGADRIQVRFTWQDQSFQAFFEALADAVWVEANAGAGEEKLPELHRLLAFHTPTEK